MSNKYLGVPNVCLAFYTLCTPKSDMNFKED